MMRLVVVLAATTPAASFKLPWSRSAPKVAGTFRHACPLVMYEDDRSEPVLIAPWTDASLLRSYKYQKLKRGEDPIQRALEQHSLTKDGLAYNND